MEMIIFWFLLWLMNCLLQLDQKGSELKLVDGYGQMVKNLNNNQIRSEGFLLSCGCA